MIRSIAFAGIAVLAVPAAAQVSGSINRDAPTVTNSIAFADGSKITIDYKAIHFGQGAWLERFEAMKGDEQRLERFNKGAAAAPIGTVTTSMPCTVAGRQVPAGSFDMFFTVSARAGWVLNLKDKGNAEAPAIQWRLALKETDSQETRLKIALTAGEAANQAQVSVAFGQQAVSVPVAPTAKDAKNAPAAQDAGAKKGEGK